MKTRVLIWLVLVVLLFVLFSTNERASSAQEYAIGEQEFYHPPHASAGWDIVTFAGSETYFDGDAQPGDGRITNYEWDFDGNGVFDWLSSHFGPAFHTYRSPGDYRAFFKVTDENGLSSIDTVEVRVKVGTGRQTLVKPKLTKPRFAKGRTSKDGTVNKYAIILGPASFETRFWTDVDTFFTAFTQELGMDSSDIYVLYTDGHPPGGCDQGDSVIIDYPVSQAWVDTVFRKLADEDQIDGDDHLYIIISGHGQQGIDPRVQPGDEPDSLESTYSPPTRPPYSSWVLEQWTGVWEGDEYHRQKYVSHFEDLHLECTDSDTTDNDIWLELLEDFLAGDTVPPYGTINEGDVINFDGDNVAAYDDTADTFDVDDWGYIDTIKVDNASRQYGPSGWSFTCALFDSSLDTTIDIDVDCESCTDTPYVDGTDTDNDGFFNGIDMNSDDDLDDTVSIDEIISHANITDDVLAEYLDSLGERPTLVAMINCFSGGFIWDLSGPKQVTMTGCREHETCAGSFLKLIAETIFDPAIADSLDTDGCVSLAEAFNYAAKANSDGSFCEPQLDDNGDRQGHAYPVSDSGDGIWSRSFGFEQGCPSAAYLFYYAHEVYDPLFGGNDDGFVNPGETINLTVTLENVDLDTAHWVRATLRTDDTLVTVTDSMEIFGNIPPADTDTCNYKYVFSVDSDCPDSHLIIFTLYTTADNEAVGNTSFEQLVLKPNFSLVCEPETLIWYLDPAKGGGGWKTGSPTFDLILDPVASFGDTVSLSVSGSCSGMRLRITPNEVTPPDTTTLQISLISSCQPQVCSTIVVTAAGGGVTKKDTLFLVLREAPENTGPVWHVATDGHDLLGDGKEDWPLRTIQKGIKLASAGDTVLVENGEYEENLVIDKDSIVVASHYARDDEESYVESTIIDAQDSGWVVTLVSCDEVTLRGFTIRNSGGSPSGGIYLHWSTSDIKNNVITGNFTGIKAQNADSTYVYRNLIFANSANGIELFNSVGARIINNTISDNQGSGIWHLNATGLCKNTIVSGNEGYGIKIVTSGGLDLSYNDVWGNQDGNCSGAPSCTDTVGSISEDPLFVEPDSGDYYLSSNSPCKNAGDPSDPVPLDGGNCIDMGAYEWMYGGGAGLPAFCGDLDRDGSVTWKDYKYLSNYLLHDGPAPPNLQAGDVNCDKAVGMGDVIYLLRYLNGTGRDVRECCR
jgi:hypothetical protein